MSQSSRIKDPADDRAATLGIMVDITDRKRAETALKESERRLVQAQKMESVGQLAGGIAHDFNNLLTVIVGNLELMEPRLTDDELRALLRRVQDAAASGADLTHRLLGFSRQLPLEPQTVNLNALVTRMSELLRRSIGEHIALSATLAPDVWEVRADPTQIETALTNLAINARDAMPNGGRLVIETRNVIVEKDQVAAERDLSPGDYVVVSVSDTGTGIPPEIRDRVFEPFFTTKPKERGTGLGLAMIYGFAKQSGGHVSLYSEVGHGTTISLYLPRASGPGAGIATSTAPAPEAAPGDQLVLLVEDDAALRQLNVERLTGLGYRVTEAATGAQALELIRSGLRPDLVFSDMIMPGGVSGLDLYEQLKAIAPETGFLLTSGYSHEIVSPHGPAVIARQSIAEAIPHGGSGQSRARSLRIACPTLIGVKSPPSIVGHSYQLMRGRHTQVPPRAGVPAEARTAWRASLRHDMWLVSTISGTLWSRQQPRSSTRRTCARTSACSASCPPSRRRCFAQQ